MDLPIAPLLWLVDWLRLILESFIYLFSARFRNKKKAEWNENSTAAKIADIGAWIAADFLLILVVVAVAFLLSEAQ